MPGGEDGDAPGRGASPSRRPAGRPSPRRPRRRLALLPDDAEAFARAPEAVALPLLDLEGEDEQGAREGKVAVPRRGRYIRARHPGGTRMPVKDPRVDAYIARSAPFARPILAHLRAVVHAAVPEVEETIKWGFPHFQHEGMLCSFASFRAHCAFGFWKARLLLGDAASGGAMGQFGRITALSDLPSRPALVKLVRKAAALNEAGVKVTRTPRRAARPEARVPADVAAALRGNARAKATFEAFSPSRRREYVEWIVEAKGADTRARRLATAVAWMAEGKSRNWKYERC
jgi:uncharacterized protein YdeI (YjbR/CyaY-like superfamily)